MIYFNVRDRIILIYKNEKERYTIRVLCRINRTSWTMKNSSNRMFTIVVKFNMLQQNQDVNRVQVMKKK